MKRKNNFCELTNRELEVLRYMSEGLSNNEISKKMNVRLMTVGHYITSIYSKLFFEDGNNYGTTRVKAVLYYQNHLKSKELANV